MFSAAIVIGTLRVKFKGSLKVTCLLNFLPVNGLDFISTICSHGTILLIHIRPHLLQLLTDWLC